MEKLILHYDDGKTKDHKEYAASNPQEALVIITRELAPEVLWKRGRKKEYYWTEVR